MAFNNNHNSVYMQSLENLARKANILRNFNQIEQYAVKTGWFCEVEVIQYINNIYLDLQHYTYESYINWLIIQHNKPEWYDNQYRWFDFSPRHKYPKWEHFLENMENRLETIYGILQTSRK